MTGISTHAYMFWVMQRLDSIEKTFSKVIAHNENIPDFKAGDKIVVKSKIKEGDKERVQAFEGVVIARQGRGAGASFTVRKISGGVGVERIFPFNSPNIVSIDRKSEGYVRRAKLYYIRDLDGKAARIQDKNIRLMESQGGHGASQGAKSSAKTSAKASEKATAPSDEGALENAEAPVEAKKSKK